MVPKMGRPIMGDFKKDAQIGFRVRQKIMVLYYHLPEMARNNFRRIFYVSAKSFRLLTAKRQMKAAAWVFAQRDREENALAMRLLLAGKKEAGKRGSKKLTFLMMQAGDSAPHWIIYLIRRDIFFIRYLAL